MSGNERSVIVAEFAIDDRRAGDEPSGQALVARAAREGFDRVVVHARATADGWAVVHQRPHVLLGGEEQLLGDLTLAEARNATCADGRITTLEGAMLAAHRKKLGLVIRIHDTLVIEALCGALGIMAGDGHGELRSRYLVIVADARVGKRLRMGAAQLPSGRSLPTDGGGWRGHIVRKLPNLARAAADADDLVISASIAPASTVKDRLVPKLAKRGAYVWIEDVAPEARADYENIGAGGLLIRTPYSD